MELVPKGVKGRKLREKSRFYNQISKFPVLNKIPGVFTVFPDFSFRSS